MKTTVKAIISKSDNPEIHALGRVPGEMIVDDATLDLATTPHGVGGGAMLG